MRFYIPTSAFLGNINHFMARFSPNDPDRLDITSDPRWFYVHPVVLCMMAAIGKPVKPENITCDVRAKTGGYLKRMGLYKFLGIDYDVKMEEHELAGRAIPLRQIQNSDDLTHFLTEIVPLLHLEPTHVEPIKYIISELVRNVLEHSYSAQGAIVCAQYHKKGNKIRLGIVDTGMGVMKSITRSHPVENELHAVRLALTPGVTGTTSKPGGSEQNAGAGLFFIKTIAFFNRDPLVIYTGHTMYKLQKRKVPTANNNVVLKADPFADRHSTVTDLPHWQGVVVGIDIDLKNAHRFAEVLRIVQEFYFQTVKEKKKAKYKRLKKPTFVD